MSPAAVQPISSAGHSSSSSRPALPDLVQGKAIKYMTGKIYIYPDKQCFRVYRKQGERADWKIKFMTYETVADAWDSALKKIEDAHDM